MYETCNNRSKFEKNEICSYFFAGAADIMIENVELSLLQVVYFL